MKNKPKIIAIEVPVTIKAAETEGDNKGPPSFDVVAYTGGAINLRYWDAPLVIDFKGLSFSKSLIANLDHDQSKRVGHVTERSKDDNKLTLAGKISAATDAAREVVESAAKGFTWQASVEASPDVITEVKAGKTITVNGQDFTGPLYVASKSTLKGFAFVSHGADDNTTVSIAAAAASTSEENQKMDPKIKAWAEAMGVDVDARTEEEKANIVANYNGQQPPKKPNGKLNLGDGIEARRAEVERVDAITEIALGHCEKRPYDIDAIKALAEQGIEGKWTVEKFRLELLEASLPPQQTVFRSRRDERLTSRILEAAVCLAGHLPDVEKQFDDQTLQAAHDRYPQSIGLNQLFLEAAAANGYQTRHSARVTIEAQRAAFGMRGPGQYIEATQFSTVSISTILSNVANKFLRIGWDSVDQTALRIAPVRNVNDYKAITTVSLVGDVQFRELTAAGEIQHATLGETSYTNQADVYARMLAITMKDLRNDDLGALSSAPKRLGRGGMLKLNDLFWKKFLDNSTFFTTARKNENTGVATMTSAGLSATEIVFVSQTDPDGKPLGVMPAILLVPTAHKGAAQSLMTSERMIDGTATAAQGDANIWRGRFRVESSPYMHNTAYTGWSAAAWYLLADPNELPVIEIAALDGNVMPTVESADADFNVLGIQLRGHSSVGVALQEYRGGVRADGSA